MKEIKLPAGPPATRFVCVFNGNRDRYQVPLALGEAGMLEALVTDFYAPARLPGWLARFDKLVRSRRIEGLARSQTRSIVSITLLQRVAPAFRVSAERIYRAIDPMLGRRAARLAQQRGQALYCYHYNLPANVPVAVPLVIFVVHPLPMFEAAILAEDAVRFPEVCESAAREVEVLQAQRLSADWSRAAAVVCASAFTARSVVADGCPADKITVIPYGRPILPQAQEATTSKGAVAEFLFVGQGIQRKGLHHLLRAWKQWRSTSDAPARLTLVCYRIDPAIAAMVDDPDVRLLGRQSNEALQALYHAADIFVLPSLVEGFGLVYLEALAAGCHVIGTRNTGLPDIAADTNSATVIEPGSIDALQHALLRCAALWDDGLLNRTANRETARRWTEARFRTSIADHARSVLAACEHRRTP